MAAVTLTLEDLEPFATIERAKAEAMIADALALAAQVAPCIVTAEFLYPAAAKAVLRRAVIRWHEAGSGARTTQAAGPFQETLETRPSRGLFWPSEINELAGLCSDGAGGDAFAVDTLGDGAIIHADICALNFGALYCSCGAVLTLGWPLYEVSW